MASVRKAIIMGAAGRDFHNFNVFFRDNKAYKVVAFTATQIPGIARRTYPKILAGRRYPQGIPIHDEVDLSKLISKHQVDDVFFSYSDVPYAHVMHRAAVAMAAGANFCLLSHAQTQLCAKVPVISVCAGRTGSGKSQTSQKVAEMLKEGGLRVVVVRHPMPYGDLAKQAVQRFASYQNMEDADCTIEEMEEYERYISRHIILYAGVDYGRILRRAEKEADVIIWDGGNNDVPFYAPDLHIVVVDPHRAGHELTYYPGEENVRMADVVIINKENTAPEGKVGELVKNVRSVNKKAVIIHADSVISLENPDVVKGKNVLVVEDGPTLTHGEMSYGAGMIAAKRVKAKPIDPRAYAVGSIKKTLDRYPSLRGVVPAMGYGKAQMRELAETIRRARCDAVVIGTPIDLARHIKIDKPTARVHYALKEKNMTLMRVLKKEGFL